MTDKLIENLMAYLSLSGNAYVEGVGPTSRSGNKPPTELYVLRPDPCRR